jgi:hypothetical protein
MDGEEAISPDVEVAPEPETPIEVEGSEEEVAEPDVESGEEAEQAEEQEPEAVEINVGGEKLRVPKGLVPEEVLNKVQDFATGLERSFTKKFQDVAEQAKGYESKIEIVEKLASLEGETLQTFSRGLQIKQQLAELKSIDHRALWQSNPDQARRLSDEVTRLEGELQHVIGETSRKEAEADQARRKFTEEQEAVGRQVVERQIKDFDESAVMEYVTKTYGMTEEQAKTWPQNPLTAIMAHKAMLYDRMQANAKPKPAQVQPAKPLSPVKGKGGAGQKAPDTMTVQEMKKHLGLPTG